MDTVSRWNLSPFPDATSAAESDMVAERAITGDYEINFRNELPSKLIKEPKGWILYETRFHKE